MVMLPSTRGHDAVGQVPREAVRGSQIGPGALGYARGTPATACRPAKKIEIFFLRKLEKPRTGSKSAVDRRDVQNNLQARPRTCARGVP